MTEHKAQRPQIYMTINKNTGESHFLASHNAQEDCKEAGALIGTCYVINATPPPPQEPDIKLHRIKKILCQICPYQYGECTKPPEGECPLRTNTPDLQEWIKQSAKAHLCQYTGVALTEKDYYKHQK